MCNQNKYNPHTINVLLTFFHQFRIYSIRLITQIALCAGYFLVHAVRIHTGKLMAESTYTITTATLMLVTRSS